MKYSPVLHVENLQIEIRNARNIRQVVKGVSFQVDKGKVFGLIGESGCGKSLICLSLLNLLPENIKRSGGEIQINGKKVNDLSNAQWRRVRGKHAALILQNPMIAFDPVYTIRRHFVETFAAHNAKFKNEFAENLLFEMGFSNPKEILNLYPFQLSGGMLQRVMIALALVHKARLLVADEPTTALDVTSQSLILDLIDHQCRRLKMGVLLVTHDLSIIARVADYVAVMRDGEFVETAPVKNIFNSPQHPYTRSLLEAYISLHGKRKNNVALETEKYL